MNKRKKKKTERAFSGDYFFLFVSFIAAFAGILFGYDTGVISGAILFINQEFLLSTFATSLVVSSVLLGAFLGSLFSGKLADYFGRKRLLIIDSIVFCLATIASSMAKDAYILIMARFFVGIAIGISSYVAPLYISEIAPPKYRGALVSLNQLAISVGILLSYIVDYFFSSQGAWGSMLLVGVFPALALLLGHFCLPDSPRWMVFSGKKTMAHAVLQKIRNSKKKADQEIEEIHANIHLQKGDIFTLFTPKIRPSLVVGAGLAILQQVTGINTILYYAPTIFQKAGFFNDTAAILATMGVGVVFVLFTILSLAMIDTLGRRALLFWGLSLMAIGLLGLSLSFAFQDEVALLQTLSVIIMMVYIIGFSIGLGPVMWLMISEVFPLKFRAVGASVSTCINWACNWIVAISFLPMTVFFGTSTTFFFYFLVTVIGIFFVYRFVPETKGISLETIEKRLYRGQFFPKTRKK